MDSISSLWSRLTSVQTLHFESQSRTGTEWNGIGEGRVEVEQLQDDVLIWRESGQWRQNGGREIRFFNTFRWTRQTGALSLEHLRFGEQQPKFLFLLALTDENIWHDVEPHLCRQDHYSAVLVIEEQQLNLSWTVSGPTRDESINYCYK